MAEDTGGAAREALRDELETMLAASRAQQARLRVTLRRVLDLIDAKAPPAR